MTRLRPLSLVPHALIRLLPPSLAKRLLLLPLLGANAAFAQYCEIDFTDAIEPITRVQFGEFDNAVVGSEALEDFTNMSIQVFPGETYDIVIEGDTAGDYENWLSVFIDWDQDGAFDGSDERYDLDDPLEDSTGSDGQQVTGQITVPITAVNGTTRMRVVKKYYELGEACGSHDYGQAEDYSLLVGEPSETVPVVTQTISPKNAQLYEAFALDLTNHFEDRSDANALTFTATGLPTGVTLDANTGAFGGAPEGIGTYVIVVKAMNPGGERVSATFPLHVEPAHEDFAGGDGSAANPWQVSTAGQLYALRHDSDEQYFELVDDIALGTAPWNVDGGWIPIGGESDSFTGVLQGNGHRITGLTINRPGVDYVGLFGYLSNASIDGVHLEDASVTGGEYVGPLGGTLINTVVSNSSASGSVTGEAYVGGLVGSLGWGSEISASGASGHVTGSSDEIGGLVGSMHDSEIADSHAHAAVVAGMYGGGLVGNGRNNVIILRSHAVGTVSVNGSMAGGLLGKLSYGGELHDSYAQVNVSGEYYVGALLGEAWGSSVSNTYAVGSVSGYAGYIGALIGYVLSYPDENQANIRDSFWSSEHADGLNAVGDIDNNDGGISQFDNLEGLSQTAMRDDAVFVTAGWDFGGVWAIAPGSYPYHVLFGAEGDGSGDDDGDGDDNGGGDNDGDDDDNGSSPAFAGGDGSLADPWQVSSAEQLDELRNFLDAHFVLTGDIDLGTAPWNTDGGWLPIGDEYSLFEGSLKGNGHTITGLTIDRPGLDYVGLFGYVWKGSISDVHLEDVSISGRNYVGALAGLLDDSTVSDSSVSGGTVRGGELSSADYAGGLVGLVAYGSSLSDSAADVTVSGDYYVGGLAGGLELNSAITGSSAIGSVTGSDYGIGGLVGTVYDDSELADSHAHVTVVARTYGGGLAGSVGGDASIRRSHAVGTVVSDETAGGLVALLSYGTELHDSYAHVNVSADEYAGGLVGEAYGSRISNSYAIGSVNGGDPLGALIGGVVSSDDAYANIRDSFWSTDHAGDLDAYGENVNYYSGVSQFDNLVGLSQTQLQNDAVFVAAGWNFDSVWAIAPGSYPYHVLFGADDDGGGDDSGSSAPFAGGTGSVADPWQVSSAEQLDELRNFLDAHFVLTADIDLGTAPWNDDGGWLPIGDWDTGFRGSLDGNGHTITGLTIDRPDMDLVGLFGQAMFASITDIRLEDVSVTGGSATGGLVGMADSSEISDVFVSGNVTSEQDGSTYVGGLVGYAGYETLISNSAADVTVAAFNFVGGLVGAMFLDTVVDSSYATGFVTGDYAVGGLVGDMDNSVQVNDSHAHATVIGDARVGGLVGSADHGVIHRSHAVGSVAGSWLGGGLVGLLSYGAELHDSYAHASVSGLKNVGGLAGDVWGGKVMNSYAVSTVSGSIAGGLVGSVYSTAEYRAELHNSYWSTDHAGGLSAYAENENDGASTLFSGLGGHTQMALRSEAPYAGWDFDAIWDIESGFYPFHRAIGSESTSSTAPPIPGQIALVNGTLSLDVSAAFHDPDHAVVGYSATGLPPGVTIDNNGIISGAPAAAGSYTVAIMAMYDGAGPRTGSVVINVLVFAGGAGTQLDPWEIDTAEQLHAMRDFPAAHFVLTADIDLGGASGPYANDGAGWEPIGGDTLGDPFTGSFDGGGHVISGLFIDRPDVDHAGLFGTIENADIRNVGLVDVDVSGGYAVAALVAYQAGGSVSNSFVSGAVSGTGSVGGLIGISEAGVLANSYSMVTITTGVSGGGGGLVGFQMEGGIGNSYASGNLAGTGLNGALIGTNFLGEINNSFWNSDAGGMTGIGCNFTGETCSELATLIPLSAAELRQQASFTGWDFTSTWTIHPLVNDGYPYLQWQNVVIPNSPPTLVSAIGNQGATQGSAFSLDVTANFADADEDALSFTASGLPASMAMHDGVISGTPTNADALIAEFTVTVSASDGTDSTNDSFTLSVANINDAPVLASSIGVRTAAQGAALSLDVSTHFSDPDGDTLAFSASGLPASLTMSDGVISGTPTNAEALIGSFVVTVMASDGEESISDDFELSIVNVNDAPVLVTTIGNHTATQGTAFSLDVSSNFDDPDATALSFSASGLPESLDISTDGLISGMPTSDDLWGSPYDITVTASDGTLSVTGSFMLTINTPPSVPPPADPVPPQSGPTVIDTSKSGETLSGNVVITENGVLDGGVIDGTIDNRGTITGNVQLAGGASINGGTVSGSISGDAAQPAVITNADIPAGTRLDNVIIGAGTTLDAGVQIGANVRFESNAAIPDAIDLTGALRQLQWAGKDARPVPDLDDDVVTDAALSLIRSIQLLPEFELTDSAVSQDASNGEIVVVTNDTRSAVLPVQVSQASADEGEGIYVNDDGDVVFVTGNRRVVLSYPVLVASDALVDALRSLGLELQYDDRANLQVAPAAIGAQTLMARDGYALRASALVNGDFYYSSRPALEAFPAYRFSAPGLYYYTVPGLPNATSLVFVFEDDAGKLLEQELVPVPADWFALKGYLEQLPGARNVRIDAHGTVSLTLDDATIRGRAGYNVGTGSADAPAGLVLKSAGDINGDGTGDYLLHYPNGDVQHLLIYPQ